MSCGAIIGGSNYYAHVSVDNKPSARIYHKNELKGTGTAVLKLKRKDADKLSFTVKDDAGREQTFKYHSRTFRGWTFTGTVLGFTGLISGIPIPWGVGVDLAAGTLWKPNVNEIGIVKKDYKNYEYHLDFSNPNKVPETPNEISANEDSVYTKDGLVHAGKIIELEPNDYIKIQKKDKSILTLKYDDIEKITKSQVR